MQKRLNSRQRRKQIERKEAIKESILFVAGILISVACVVVPFFF